MQLPLFFKLNIPIISSLVYLLNTVMQWRLVKDIFGVAANSHRNATLLAYKKLRYNRVLRCLCLNTDKHFFHHLGLVIFYC